MTFVVRADSEKIVWSSAFRARMRETVGVIVVQLIRERDFGIVCWTVARWNFEVDTAAEAISTAMVILAHAISRAGAQHRASVRELVGVPRAYSGRYHRCRRRLILSADL
jgi:hypothetical protein